MQKDTYQYNQQQNIKQKEKNKLKVKKKSFFLIFVIIVCFVFAIRSFTEKPQILLLKETEIEDSFKAKGVIMRDEALIFSPQDGDVFLKQKEGERIAYGNSILLLKRDNAERIIRNYKAGYISYAFDGLENQINYSNFQNITMKDVSTIQNNYRHIVNGDYVQKEEPIFRIINSYVIYVIIKVPKEVADRYVLNEIVFVKYPQDNDNMKRSKIIHKVEGEKNSLLFVEIGQFIDDWLSLREANVVIIKNVYHGIVVPRDAVFSQTSGKGVLVKNKDKNYEFKKITIRKNLGTQLIIKEGLNEGDQVVLNPEVVNYGRSR
ncbi:MAG: HlyD family efflux transporter periplasmic adaptor subunit [bacterium]